MAEQPLGSRRAVLASDSQGAAFYVAKRGQDSDNNYKVTAKPISIKWRAIAGLTTVFVAILTEMNWVWGLLFLFWVASDIKRGSTYFFEYVERYKNPVTYWSIVATWAVLSLYLLLEPVVNI